MAAKNRQRWRKTKWRFRCSECGNRMPTSVGHWMGTCSVTCSMHSVGMSWADFY